MVDEARGEIKKSAFFSNGSYLIMENKILQQWEDRYVAFFDRAGGLTDGSHDLGHFQRVWRTARAINRLEGSPGDELTLLTAAYFHDFVALPKNHPRRYEASRLSAERAADTIL